MLENLSTRLQGIFSGLRGKGRLTEDDINDAMREIRMALLEADVNFKVVKSFVARTKERCLDAEVLDSLTPAQNVIKIVLDELTELLGRTDSKLVLSSRIPNVIMLVGLQGSGKTTAAAKLAYRLKQENHSPLLVAYDVYRPAAADQLAIWADRAQVEIVRHEEGSDPAAVVFDAMNAARARRVDVVLVDTAGRLHNKQNLMNELNKIRRVIDREGEKSSKEVLLVLDATTGQNGLIQAKQFGESAGITGIVLTKLDGTAKGGVVVAIAKEMGVPVKFVGLGEGIDDLQPFDPVAFVNALI